MSRTTDKPKDAAKAVAKIGAVPQTPKGRSAKRAQNVAPRAAAPRLPSLAEARRRMQVGRTFWDDLTSEQRAAGLEGPEASGRAPTLAQAAQP